MHNCTCTVSNFFILSSTQGVSTGPPQFDQEGGDFFLGEKKEGKGSNQRA